MDWIDQTQAVHPVSFISYYEILYNHNKAAKHVP